MNCWPYKAGCSSSCKTQEPCSEASKSYLIPLTYTTSMGCWLVRLISILLCWLAGHHSPEKLPMIQFIYLLLFKTNYSSKIQVSHSPYFLSSCSCNSLPLPFCGRPAGWTFSRESLMDTQHLCSRIGFYFLEEKERGKKIKNKRSLFFGLNLCKLFFQNKIFGREQMLLGKQRFN